LTGICALLWAISKVVSGDGDTPSSATVQLIKDRVKTEVDGRIQDGISSGSTMFGIFVLCMGVAFLGMGFYFRRWYIPYIVEQGVAKFGQQFNQPVPTTAKTSTANPTTAKTSTANPTNQTNTPTKQGAETQTPGADKVLTTTARDISSDDV
jgi:hypothetical protein